jgi:hypothetical protein
MAKQLQATVYQIEGMPQGTAFEMSFPTDSIIIKEGSSSLISEVNSEILFYPNPTNPIFKQSFLVSETYSALITSANTGGTSQVEATVLAINGNAPRDSAWSFPASEISIWPFVSGNFNSFIIYKGIKYYVSETEDALVAAANSGSSGSGGGTVLQSPDLTLWLVTVNNAGVLQTRVVETGTAGTLHLFSPDNTEWNVTVNNSGALETTAI